MNGTMISHKADRPIGTVRWPACGLRALFVAALLCILQGGFHGYFPEICREAHACTGLEGPPPPEIAMERAVVSPVREGYYRWPSQSPTLEDLLAGPRTSSEPMLVILYKFQDTANPLATSVEQDWVNCASGDLNSVADYWDEVSYGSLTLTRAAETGGQANNNGVVGWYTSAKNSTDARYDAGNGYLKRGTVIYDAIVASDPHVNYANFDTDNDGYISDDELHIVVIVAAYEASYASAPSPQIWRVNWWMTDTPGNYPTLDGKKICVQGHGTTAIIGERYYKGAGNPTKLSEFGIIAHEVGHQLGFPDLYDTDESSLCWGGLGQGLGYWDLMATGDWLAVQGTEAGHTPAHVSAWLKAYRGWLIPTEVTDDVTGVWVQDVETNAVAYKLWTSGQYGEDNKEYFLVENRQKTGYDRALKGDGLVVYHVDEGVKDGDVDDDEVLNWADNDLQWDATHEFIDLECADGFTRNADGSACADDCPDCARDDLDVWTRHDNNACPNTVDFFNRGDATDPWYLGHKTTFDKDSCPSSRDHNGNDTMVEVKNISVSSLIMTADLIVGSQNQNPCDIWLKDCPADVGAEPDANCANNFWSSPDIWIDNDRDGIQDAPSFGKKNRFFVGVRNRGAGPAVNVSVNLYHRNNSTGLTFPTGAVFDWIQVIGLVPAGGAVRTEVFPTIPNPPQDGHWCYGVVLTAVGDPLNVDSGLTQTNNKACVNVPVLAERAGQNIQAEFEAGNPDDDSSPGGGMFDVQIYSNLPAGWYVQFTPGAELPVYIEKGESVPMSLEIIPPAGDWHGFAGTVRVEQYWVSPPLGPAGGIDFLVYQDNRPPQLISDLAARAVVDSTGGGAEDSLFVRLGWTPVAIDIGGTQEMIEHYEVHRSLEGDFIPAAETLIDLASADQDTGRAGFQYFDHDPALERHVTYYYRVVPVDQVDWRGEPSNVASAIADPIRAYADLDAGDFAGTVTDRGILGFLDGSQTEGSGFVFPADGSNQLFLGGLWVGREESYVANRDYDADPEKEWEVSRVPEGYLADNPGPADQGYTCAFVDSAATGSIGLYVRQESYAWSEEGMGRYALLRYRIENRGDDALTDLYAGIFCDWDVGSQYLQNQGRAEAQRDLVYIFHEGESLWLGARLLAGSQTPPTANLTLIDNATYVWPNEYVLDADKYLFLSAADPDHVLSESPDPGDYSALVSAGPFTLEAGELQEVVFALVAGASLEELREAADQAAGRYPFEQTSIDDAVRPTGRLLLLEPNRPNPFRSTTGISYYLPENGEVDLRVFDIRGRRVRDLVRGEVPQGWHQTTWDGRDEEGRRAAAGIYFSRIRVNGDERSRRMILLK